MPVQVDWHAITAEAVLGDLLRFRPETHSTNTAGRRWREPHNGGRIPYSGVLFRILEDLPNRNSATPDLAFAKGLPTWSRLCTGDCSR